MQPSALHIAGDLNTDYAQWRMMVDGKPVELTATEYAVLHQLAASPQGADPRAAAQAGLGTGAGARGLAAVGRDEQAEP